jgi:hypothetical protein
MDDIGLGAFLRTDKFIRVVAIWELGRTLVTCAIETIVLTKWRCYPLNSNIVYLKPHHVFIA